MSSLNISYINRYKNPKNESNVSTDFWIVNENLFVAPLLPILKEIHLFATLTKEVIIVNFVDFPIGALALACLCQC